jgi:hypothetical protein
MVQTNEKPFAERPSAAAKPGLPFGSRPRKRISYCDNREPALADLLTDPILQRLLSSDGVRQDHLIDLIADVKVRLARREMVPA